MKNSKKLMIALAISILLNAFLLGTITPHIFMRGHRPPMRNPKHKMERATARLPEQYKDKVMEILNQHKTDHHDKMRHNFDKMKHILTADKFDAEVFKASIKEIEDSDREMKKSLENMMLSIATTLPDKLRIEFFKDFTHRRPPPPMHRR